MIKGLKQKISYFEIFILLLFMFPLSFITVLAVENSTSDTQMAAESLTGGIKSDAVAAKNPFIIKSIEIQGSKTMPNETILGILQTRTGEEVQLKRIRDDVRELYKLGQFSNIQVDSSGSDEGISLKFIMEEWPKVKEITFSGNHEVNDSKIKDIISIATGRSLSGNLLNENKNKIISLYQKRGYYLAQVEPEIIKNPDDSANINFKITEGKKVKVEEIDLVGNKLISDRELKKVMKIKKGKRFDDTYFEGDLKSIISHYQQNGFVKAKVMKSGKELNQDKSGFLVRIEIDEGPQFRVGKIDVNIRPHNDQKPLFTNKDVINEFTMEEGDVFNELVFQEGIAKINKLYLDKGRVFVQVIDDRNYDPAQEIIDLKLNISEGGLAYIDSVPINWVSETSNEPHKTREYIIRRELDRFDIKEGKLFSYQNIEDARRKILTLGPFIRGAQPQPRLSLDADSGNSQKVTVNFNIEESRQSGMFSIAGGYGSGESSRGLFGAMDIWDDNILGRAWRLHLRGEIGTQERRTGQVTFSTPWMFNNPISLNLSLYSRTRIMRYYYDDDNKDIPDKRYKSLGGSITIGRPITRQIDLSLGLRNDKITYEERDISTEEVKWGELVGKGGIVRSIKLIADRDTRQFLTSMFDPNRGSFNVLSAEYSGLLGGLDFQKYMTESSIFLPTWWKLVLVFHLQTGYLSGKNSQALEYERFVLGSMDTVRGYNYSIRPKDNIYGGNKMAILNVEYRFPITSILRGLVFFDAGQAWGDNEWPWNNFKPSKSIGLGIRIDMLGALARLEYAYALDEKGDSGIKFEIGPAF